VRGGGGQGVRPEQGTRKCTPKGKGVREVGRRIPVSVGVKRNGKENVKIRKKNRGESHGAASRSWGEGAREIDRVPHRTKKSQAKSKRVFNRPKGTKKGGT